MLKTLNDVETYLAELPIKQYDYTERLAYVKEILQTLGSPQDALPAIHIAGTSGKGSTAYYAADMLGRAGYTVGLSVSPHVNKVSERAQVNGAPLPDNEYCRHLSEFIGLTNKHGLEFSYIELLSTFSFWLFAKLELDYMVVEVGLGGRLDPTNVMTRQNKVCVITDIGLDHTEILGDTLAKIAEEKAGIVQPGSSVITHEQSPEIMAPINYAVDQTGAIMTTVAKADPTSAHLPAFQQRNWTLARRAVKARLAKDGRADLSAEAAEQSLELVIPGRFELFQKQNIDIILDTAHNPQKMTALTQGIAQRFPDKHAVYVVAFGDNKHGSIDEMLRIIRQSATALITTTFTAKTGVHRTAMDPQQLVTIAKSADFVHTYLYTEGDPYAALKRAISLATAASHIVVVTGSFYLIDGIRASLLK